MFLSAFRTLIHMQAACATTAVANCHVQMDRFIQPQSASVHHREKRAVLQRGNTRRQFARFIHAQHNRQSLVPLEFYRPQI